jgi:hypothetical protein
MLNVNNGTLKCRMNIQYLISGPPILTGSGVQRMLLEITITSKEGYLFLSAWYSKNKNRLVCLLTVQDMWIEWNGEIVSKNPWSTLLLQFGILVRTLFGNLHFVEVLDNMGISCHSLEHYFSPWPLHLLLRRFQFSHLCSHGNSSRLDDKNKDRKYLAIRGRGVSFIWGAILILDQVYKSSNFLSVAVRVLQDWSIFLITV